MTIDWQPAAPPYGMYSFVPPEGEPDVVDGREHCVGITDAHGRPVWRDADGNLWAGPWPAEARATKDEE